MFRGNFIARVDKKLRLKIPSSFKQQIDESRDNRFFITSATGQDVDIYPLSEWEKIDEKLLSSLGSETAVKSYLQKTAYYGEEVTMDAHGRLKLPQRLCAEANIAPGVEVAVSGRAAMFSAVNREQLEASLSQQLSNADRQALAEVLHERINPQKNSENAS
jgi:MraZ protein